MSSCGGTARVILVSGALPSRRRWWARLTAMNFVRAKVSQGRSRFKDDEVCRCLACQMGAERMCQVDLDFTYIRPNVIAMGFPASGVESTYRNPIGDVARTLKRYHSDQYLIFNCSERTYDYSKFNGQVLDFGWPDHHAPPLEILFQLVHAMHKWVSADPQNTAVVHCIAGKGRTGTAISAYLFYAGYADSADAALTMFDKERQGGVTYPSQARFVNYFASILQGYRPPNRVWKLDRIVMKDIPLYAKNADSRMFPFIEVYWKNTQLLFSSKPFSHAVFSRKNEDGKREETRAHSLTKHDGRYTFMTGELKLYGDVLIIFKNDALGTEKYFFRFSFHTGFIPKQGYVRFLKKDLCNGYKDKHIPDDFFVDLYLSELVPEEKQPPAPPGPPPPKVVAAHLGQLEKKKIRDKMKDPEPHPWPWESIVEEYQKRQRHHRRGSDAVTMHAPLDIRDEYLLQNAGTEATSDVSVNTRPVARRQRSQSDLVSAPSVASVPPLDTDSPTLTQSPPQNPDLLRHGSEVISSLSSHKLPMAAAPAQMVDLVSGRILSQTTLRGEASRPRGASPHNNGNAQVSEDHTQPEEE